MKTDTSERGLERLICKGSTGFVCDPSEGRAKGIKMRPSSYGAGWVGGQAEDYDREYCVTSVLKDDTELFKQFMDNDGFRRWMTDAVFGLTYETPPAA